MEIEAVVRASGIVLVILLGSVVGGTLPYEQVPLAPAQARPYFMPPSERARILGLVQKEGWAQAELKRLKAAAEKGDGLSAAFLYAVEEDLRYLPAAREWLLQYSRQGGDLGQQALEAGPEFFKGGQPGLPGVYYGIDATPLVAYDWVYKGLSAQEREALEAGILASARFRMRAMDRWSHAPNLVFKPTYMVAMAGLATGRRDLLDWGFYRKPLSPRGGYFQVLNIRLWSPGPWHEAPIYPIAHQNLLLMIRMSNALRLFTGEDWFHRKSAGGGSVQGLFDYYLDIAYPIERTGYGAGQVRIATHGDGATSADGDLFLVNPAGPGMNMHEELAEAYRVSGDGRYAGFLAMVPDYKPDLLNRRPLLPDAAFPQAPSRVWPEHGLAMLRSDESPGYWTSGKAIAAFQIMTQGYGLDHRDKFSITLHGAGRLLYPDYNAIQYENPAIGWTRNSIAHNTLVVDEGETRNAAPTGVRHDFTPAVKFLATSASGVFEGVDQTRALLLTRDYLLDLFEAASQLPRTYDYLLHSFGEPRPADPGAFRPSSALVKRYWLLENPRATTTGRQWSLDFVLDEAALRRKEAFGDRWFEMKQRAKPRRQHGLGWYRHTAAVRVTMAGEPDTLVTYGLGMHEVPMLVARRADRRRTLFVATHEPFANAERPRITAITTLARSSEAVLVRVESEEYTDYAAVAFGPQKGLPEHALASSEDPRSRFAFRNYGYLRVARDGGVSAWGGWVGFSLPDAAGPLTLNGKPVPSRRKDRYLVFGGSMPALEPPLRVDPANPLPVRASPAAVRVFRTDRREMTFAIRNVLDHEVSGRIEFEPPPGLRVEPRRPAFGPLAPGATANVVFTVIAAEARAGRQILLYRLHYGRPGTGQAVRTGAEALPVMVGPVLEHVYQHPRPAVYRVSAPRFTAALDMFHGLARYLADDDDTVRLDGAPLFTYSDGKELLLSEATDHAFTWPTEAPARLTAHTYDRARYDVLFGGDRMVVNMDPDWAQFPRAQIVFPGKWRSPAGPPAWRRVITAEPEGAEPRARDAGRSLVAAAELAFPGARWNLCFGFLPPQDVVFDGAGLAFDVEILQRERWSVGFCRPGSLDLWRREK